MDDPFAEKPYGVDEYGELDNGLTYYVRSNSKPRMRAALALAVKAGYFLYLHVFLCQESCFLVFNSCNVLGFSVIFEFFMWGFDFLDNGWCFLVLGCGMCVVFDRKDDCVVRHWVYNVFDQCG